MNRADAYRLTLSTTLWGLPALLIAALISEWGSQAAVGLAVMTSIALGIRAATRVGSLTMERNHHFRFESASGSRSQSWQDISWVIPFYHHENRLGIILALRPWWRRALLLPAPIPEDVLRSWAKAGVKVAGLSPARLADERRVEEFFERD